MLKTVIEVRVCCAVVFYEKLIVVFKLKFSQIGTEIDKNPKILSFQFFCAAFVKFMTDFVDWNVEKGKGKSLLSSSLL